jgi:hypothetical protein
MDLLQTVMLSIAMYRLTLEVSTAAMITTLTQNQTLARLLQAYRGWRAVWGNTSDTTGDSRQEAATVDGWRDCRWRWHDWVAVDVAGGGGGSGGQARGE